MIEPNNFRTTHRLRMKLPMVIHSCAKASCFLALIWCLSPSSTMAVDTQLPTLAELKIDGRGKSNFLNQAKSQPTLTGVPKANIEQYRSVIQPLLKAKCVACHGPDEENANLRIDRINPNLLTGESIERWREIYKVLSNSRCLPRTNPLMR